MSFGALRGISVRKCQTICYSKNRVQVHKQYFYYYLLFLLGGTIILSLLGHASFKVRIQPVSLSSYFIFKSLFFFFFFRHVFLFFPFFLIPSPAVDFQKMFFCCCYSSCISRLISDFNVFGPVVPYFVIITAREETVAVISFVGRKILPDNIVAVQ